MTEPSGASHRDNTAYTTEITHNISEAGEKKNNIPYVKLAKTKKMNEASKHKQTYRIQHACGLTTTGR